MIEITTGIGGGGTNTDTRVHSTHTKKIEKHIWKANSSTEMDFYIMVSIQIEYSMGVAWEK